MKDITSDLKKRAKLRKAMGSIKGANIGKEISSTIKSASAAVSEVPTTKKVKESKKESRAKSAAVSDVPTINKQDKVKYEQSGKGMEGQISDIVEKLKIGAKVGGVKKLNEKDRSKIIDNSDSIDEEGRYYKKQKKNKK